MGNCGGHSMGGYMINLVCSTQTLQLVYQLQEF